VESFPAFASERFARPRAAAESTAARAAFTFSRASSDIGADGMKSDGVQDVPPRFLTPPDVKIAQQIMAVL